MADDVGWIRAEKVKSTGKHSADSRPEGESRAAALAFIKRRREYKLMVLVILVATLLGLLVELFQEGGVLREYFWGP